MVVLFDFYMKYPEHKEIVTKDIELISIFRGLTEFIFERLDPLKYEIDKEELEEQNNEDKKRFIIVWVLLGENNKITFEGYSDKLKLKMTSCFSKSDMDYFINKTINMQKIRNN